MINQLEAIGAQRTPEGYLLRLDVESLLACINTNQEFVKLKFDWIDKRCVSRYLEIEKDFGYDQFDEMIKCIEEFKTFARVYL